MKNLANSVLLERPNYAKHNLTSETKTTGVLGQLIPVMFQEVVPGDTIDLNAEFMTKFQPMLTPAMENFNAHIHYFYIPFRILWPNWEYFIAQQPAPGASVPPLHPHLKLIDAEEVTHGFGTLVTGFHTLAPYFGLNNLIEGTEPLEINPFPFAAYQLIYNEYYRHEKIHPDRRNDITLSDGLNDDPTYQYNICRWRTYKDDYFTAALESPQLGTEAKLELSDSDPVRVKRNVSSGSGQSTWNVTGGAVATSGAATYVLEENNGVDPTMQQNALYVDPKEMVGLISMNDLIELNRMQEFLVRLNLAGSRYKEFIKANFAIDIDDLRIDRPDYICGIKAPVIISELLNTGAAQGTQTGQGSSYSEGGRGNYHVKEHGIIMGIYSCIPALSYTTAVQRFLFKRDSMSYFLPVFDQMGEQEILNKEINLLHQDPDLTFGYVPRYSEYRLPFNLTTGEFVTTLTTWHLSKEVGPDVILDSDFFDIIGPDRVFGVEVDSADSILIRVVNSLIITRPMNKYSMPVLTNNHSNFI